MWGYLYEKLICRRKIIAVIFHWFLGCQHNLWNFVYFCFITSRVVQSYALYEKEFCIGQYSFLSSSNAPWNCLSASMDVALERHSTKCYLGESLWMLPMKQKCDAPLVCTLYERRIQLLSFNLKTVKHILQNSCFMFVRFHRRTFFHLEEPSATKSET